MSAIQTEHDLKEALDAFEAALHTPVVSGELQVWSAEVRNTFATLSPLILQQLNRLHGQQYRAMTQEDPEIFPRVDNLKEEDKALAVEQRKLGQLVDRLANLAPLVEPDESKFHDLRETLCKEGIEFISRMKRQQVAIQTWYIEAFNRDRGNAD